MKQLVIISVLAAFSIASAAQENSVTLSGGYAFANLEEVDANATGWRIEATYEFNPNQGFLAHGICFGYIGTKAEYTSGLQTSEFKMNNWPLYYAPKLMFGSDKIKGFVKGALGVHFSGYSRTGVLDEEPSTADTGFFGGASLGGILYLSEAIFINVEYKWAYLSNYYYRDGFMNSAMGGVGVRF